MLLQDMLKEVHYLSVKGSLDKQIDGIFTIPGKLLQMHYFFV